MNNFYLFLCGLVVTGITGMGIITSEVFLRYARFVERTTKKKKHIKEQDTSLIYTKLQEGLMKEYR